MAIVLTDGVPLDAEIAPLCEALSIAGCHTVYSCGAHLDTTTKDRAYVTFTCRDAWWVAGLRGYLIAPRGGAHRVQRTLRFDCLLGRYTVSLRAGPEAAARRALDAALADVTAWVRGAGPVRDGDETGPCPIPDGREPQSPVPCRLTLDSPPLACAWTGAPIGDACSRIQSGPALH